MRTTGRTRRVVLAVVLAATVIAGGNLGAAAGGKVGIDPGGPLGWVGPRPAAAGHNPNGGNPCWWDPDACMSAR